MKCNITTIKKLRDTLAITGEEAKNLVGEVSSKGESFELTSKLFDDFVKGIRDPQETLNKLNTRVESLSRPFHIAMRRELGEELQVTVDGVEKKHYLLGSTLVPNKESPTGFQVVVRMAPHDSIGDVKTFIFDLSSDTSTENIGSTVGTIDGFNDLLKKAVLSATKHELSQRKKKEAVDYEGDKELKQVLDRMQEADTILGSRQKRNGNSLLGYEKIEDFTHGDIDSMRALMAKLHVLGNSKAPGELLTYYNTLLGKMHPRFFNHLTMYLKKNSVATEGYINYTENTMVLDIKAKTQNSFTQSEAEVYMHEVIHAMTAWALRQSAINVGVIKTQLNKAMKVAKQHIKWQDFLHVQESVASSRDIERAKAQRDYIFASDNNIEEFMAYTLTNPALMKLTQNIKLSDDKSVKKPTTVFESVVKLFSKLINSVLGGFGFKDNDITVFEEVNKLSFALAEINNRSLHNLDNMNPIGGMMEVLEDAESVLAKKINWVKKKVSSNGLVQLPAEDAGLYTRSKFVLTSIYKGFSNPLYRGFLGLWASAFRIPPEGTIREVLGSLFDKDAVFKIAESRGLLMSSLDAGRNSVINATSKQILEAFKVPLSDAEDSALTEVLIDTNLTSLRYSRPGRKKMSDKEMVSILTNEAARYTQEGRIKYKIKELLKKDPERAKWVTAQAVSLGYYMATGIGHSALVLNAEGIVRGFGTNERFLMDKSLGSLVSDLAAVHAIKHVETASKESVARLLKEETAGVNVITNMYEGYKRTSKEHLFKGSTVHMIDGHSKELFDDSVDIKIAAISDRADMEAKGYTMRYALPSQSGVAQRTPMAMYTTGSWGKTERLRGAVALGKLHSKGTSLSNLKRMEDAGLADALFQRDFANVYNTAISTHNAMRNGTFDVSTLENGLIPIYDQKGNVVDYRYIMSKENKKKVLLQDTRASQVLPRSMASIQYQISTEELNKGTLLAIKEDMQNNWKEGEIGEDGYSEYLLIGPNSTDPKMLELYAMLPDSYREFILSRTDKTMAVRRDLSRIYFGGAHMRTSDMIGINLLPGVFKTIINTVEGLWMELIKISKGTILLKMPMILVLNITTNILFQITQGSTDIPQLYRDYKESIVEVNEYIKYKRDAERLEQELIQDRESLRRVKNSSALKNIIGEKTTELKRIRQALLQNPAHELFEAGMYQSHIEDLHNSALSETNRITKSINARMEKLPTLVRGAAEIAYLTQNTAWYKASQEVLQRSDMISRMVENKQKTKVEYRMADGSRRLPQWWLADKDSNYGNKKVLMGAERKEFLEKAKTLRMEGLLHNYINYTLPNGNFEEYMNRLGFLMFTKYFKRIQSVIVETSLSNPIKSSILFMAVSAGLKVDMIQDQAIIGRLFDGDGNFSFSNLIPIYSPLYHIENVFTPALIKDEHLGGIF